MAVMLFHLSYWIGSKGSTPYQNSGGHFLFPWAAGTSSIGRVGVQTFFVISGFVIAYSAQNTSPGAFFVSRFRRLVPGAWICATITLSVLLLFGNSHGPVHLVMAWLRTIAFVPVGYIDGVYWTLGIECVFYALVLATIALADFNAVEKLFLIIVAISTIFNILTNLVFPYLGLMRENRALQLLLIVHGADFGVGVFLWFLLFKGQSRLRWAGLSIAALGAAVQVYFFAPRIADRSPMLIAWLISLLAIYLSVLFNDTIHEKLGDGGRRLFRSLGLMTYPLYLVHTNVGTTLMRHLYLRGFSQTNCLLAALIVMTGLAYCVATVFEPWLRSLLTPLLEPVGQRADALWLKARAHETGEAGAEVLPEMS